MSATVPFTALEEAVFHIERKYSPWNVQIEVTAEEIDAERVHEAAVDACNSHPLARARRKEHQGLDTELLWEIPDSVESVPVDETYVGSDRELGEVRTRFYSGDIDLTDGVPFRVLVTHRDGQDRLLVCASHVPCDGVGALRFTRSVCQTYRGEEVDDDRRALLASVLDLHRGADARDLVVIADKQAVAVIDQLEVAFDDLVGWVVALAHGYVLLWNLGYQFSSLVVLVPAIGGSLVVVNWRDQPRKTTTVGGEPRGPPTDLRMPPTETEAAVCSATAFELDRQVDLPPHHYALAFDR